MTIVKVNLACGNLAIPGFLGVDIFRGPYVELLAKVSQLPFKTNSIGFIYAGHIAEHMPDTTLIATPTGFREVLGMDQFMSEVSRVLEPGGRVMFRAPYLQNPMPDPFHFRQISEHTFAVYEASVTGTGLQVGRTELRRERWYISALPGNPFLYAQNHFPRLWKLFLQWYKTTDEFPDGRARVKPVFAGKRGMREITMVMKKVGP